MDTRTRQIVDMKYAGLSLKQIADKFETSTDNVSRILSTLTAKQYAEKRKTEINSRKNSSQSERVAVLLDRLIESVEYAMDSAVTDTDRLRLSDTIAGLTRIVQLPDSSVKDRVFPIVLVPSSETPEEFNSRSQGENPKGKGTPKAPEGVLTPGGSEIHPPRHLTENPKKAPYQTIEEELKDIEAEVQRNAETYSV